MASIKPLDAETARLIGECENMSGSTAVFHVRWKWDHHQWKGRLDKTQSVVERRRIAGDDTISATVQGDRATADWPVTWASIGNAEKEVYAVIRAEYRFIKDNGWTKVSSKKASQGIDSLFRKGEGPRKKFAICESKCTSDTASYARWLQGASSPLGKLGRPEPAPQGTPLSANGVTQMSEPWIIHAYSQEMGGTPNPTVIGNLSEMRRWELERRRMPQPWLNVYAVAPFYLLPGVYEVRLRVEAQQRDDPVSGDLIAEWSDEKYRPFEFFALEARTARSPGIKGDFHDYSRQFADYCRRDQINRPAVQNAARRVNSRFA